MLVPGSGMDVGVGFMNGSIGRALYVGIVLAFAAGVLVNFYFIYGFPLGDSASFNLAWAVTFSQQFWAGDLYPRWLTGYPVNLGSPVFYFYGPLPFFLLALIDGGYPALTPTETMTVLHVLLYWSSGLAFFLWGRRYVSQAVALVCACLYMAAPYHVLDVDHRNAIGEAMAFVFLPLIFRYLLDGGNSGRRWILACPAYAGLIMAHLPSALLATPFMILAVIMVYWNARARGFVRLSTTGLCGGRLAGPYLVPALGLRDWLPSDAWLNGPNSWPESWLLPQGFFFRSGGLLYGGILATAGLAILMLTVVILLERRKGEIVPRHPVLIFALVGLAVVAFLLSEASVLLWQHVGPLRNVQFPFRLGVISDFLSVTVVLFALQRLAVLARLRVRWTWHVATLALIFIMITGFVSFTDIRRVYLERRPQMEASPLTCCTQAPEYWMASVLRSRLFARGGTLSVYQAASNSFEPLLADRPLQPEEQLNMSQIVGGVAIEARLAAPAEVRIGQAYLPLWELRSADSREMRPLRADPETGLIVAEIPAGKNRYLLKIPETPAEWWGKMAGLIGLIWLVVAAFLSRPAVRAGDAARSGL